MLNCRLLNGVVTGVMLAAFLATPSGGSGTNYNDCKGHISIQGSTNINTFKLNNSLSQIILKRCNHDKDSFASLAKKYWLQIPAKNFKADNPQIYRDFLSLIKAKTYPMIKVGLSLADLHRISGCSKPTTFTVEVQMAGNSCTYFVNCRFSACSNNCIVVSGSQKMKLTDFRITPPEKILGLIKVNNEILVNFGFVVSFQ